MARQLETQHGRANHDVAAGPYGAPDIKERSRWIVIAAVLLALLGGVMLVYGKPVYVHFRTKRGLRFAREAEEQLAVGKIQASGAYLQTALKLATFEPAVWRAAAHFCASNYLRGGINYYGMLIHHPAGTREDRLGYVDLALDLHLFDEAAPILNELSVRNPKDPVVLAVQVRYLKATGRGAEAEEAARMWLNLAPESEAAQFVLGSLLLNQKVHTQREEGRRLLWALALGRGRARLAASEILAPDSELTRGENAVACGGGAAALDVAEDGDAGLEPRAELDLVPD